MASLIRPDSMHRTIREDEWSSDSGIGDCSQDASSSSSSSENLENLPIDFVGTKMSSGISTQKLNNKMATMYIGGEKKKIGNDDWKEIIDLDDECARDCDAMPPPALPQRRVLGDITKQLTNSPVSSKSYSRNATMPTTAFGGPRARKRSVNDAPFESNKPFGSIGVGKRWRRAETTIDEHSEVASTSYASYERSSQETSVTFARPHTITRVQSTSVLEKGIYAQHRDENVPKLLEVSYSLTHLEQWESPVYRRIKAGTLAEMIRTMGDEFHMSYTLIDCRYPYEFEGGHIQGAMNVYDPSLVDARFFAPSTSLLKKEEGKQKIPIFYCEFSQKRGPSMAQAVRAFDRIRNSDAYPHVDHAEMYVLDGGYRGFFNAVDGFKDLCLPCGYVEMEEAKYKKEMDKFKHHKSRNLLSGTVSRLPPPTTQEAKLARRAEQAANSPISVSRGASRRALTFTDDPPSSPSSSSSPSSRSLFPLPLPNPQFS